MQAQEAVADRMAQEKRQRVRLERLLDAAAAKSASAGLASSQELRSVREAARVEANELSQELAALYFYARRLEDMVEAARNGELPLPKKV